MKPSPIAARNHARRDRAGGGRVVKKASITNERPILMSAPMVRAILEGRKIQTRRLVKFPAGFTADKVLYQSTVDGAFCFEEAKTKRFVQLRSRYGQPGFLLWAKETFCLDDNRKICFRADNWTECPAWNEKWAPSIFMPRRASRITLEVTGVRVERLQAISEADAQSEGCDPAFSHRAAYETLWESINGKGSWNANPWVWVIEFRRLTP